MATLVWTMAHVLPTHQAQHLRTRGTRACHPLGWASPQPSVLSSFRSGHLVYTCVTTPPPSLLTPPSGCHHHLMVRCTVLWFCPLGSGQESSLSGSQCRAPCEPQIHASYMANRWLRAEWMSCSGRITLGLDHTLA